MKLHRTKAYTRAGKDYHVWKVNLPTAIVEELGWEAGAELLAKADRGRLVITRQ